MVYKLLAQYRQTGSVAPQKNRCGRHPTLNKQALDELDHKIQEKPDITLSEVREELHMPLSVASLSRILREKLGYRFKKRWYTPVSKTDLMSKSSGSIGQRKLPE